MRLPEWQFYTTSHVTLLVMSSITTECLYECEHIQILNHIRDIQQHMHLISTTLLLIAPTSVLILQVMQVEYDQSTIVYQKNGVRASSETGRNVKSKII